jgi:nitrile hydratase accessory protein
MSAARNPFEKPSFSNPWSLRVFAVTLAASEAGLFSLQDFQRALIARIQAHEAEGRCIDSDESYYSRWTEALTALLATKQLVAPDRLTPAEQAVRDALKALQGVHVHGDDDDDDHEHHHADEARPQPRPVHVEAAR